MISLYPLSETPKTIRKKFVHEPDVFIHARNFFHRNKDMRHHKVVVTDAGGTPLYCMGWSKNNPVKLDKNDSLIQMHLSNYWEYSGEDEGLDYSYVDRYQLIIYENLEEYSYHTARMVLRHNPDMKIAFTDPNAALFFAGNERVFVVGSEDELFEDHPELKELKALRAMAAIQWVPQGVFSGNVASFLIMTSLYWIKREFYYGPENPDKTFYLIKQPVKENGLTALIANVIGVKQMIRHIRPEFIPVVDLGIARDPNQFAGTTGEDVWEMFFDQLSPYSLEEVYNSQHVILDQNSNMNFNPYLTEFFFSNIKAEMHYGDDLQYKKEVLDYTESILSKIFPKEKKHILAVVVRGTDYLLPKDSKYLLSKYLPHGITPEETLEKAIRYVKEKNFDNVFLATEDAHILELFTQSELKDRLLYVDQKRMDYTKEENQDKLLMDVYQDDEGSDPYHRTLDYIAVLEGVSRCDALLANLTCGAVTYALCRKDSFEFVDVRKLEQAK